MEQLISRRVPLEGIANFRDLGGYRSACGRRTCWQLVYRSSQLRGLTERDHAALRDLKIRVAVDFRSTSERGEFPHEMTAISGVVYRCQEHGRLNGNLLRVLNEPGTSGMQLRQAMIDQYHKFPYEFADLYARLFDDLVSGPLPLVFNCAAGKDRTGVAAALLLWAMGVDWEDIVADYLLTNESMPRFIKSLEGSTLFASLRAADPAVIAPLLAADRVYIEAMREAIQTRNGSIDGYLQAELKLGADALVTLKNRLLI